MKTILSEKDLRKDGDLSRQRLMEGISGVSDYKESPGDGSGFISTFKYNGETIRMMFGLDSCPDVNSVDPMRKDVRWKIVKVFERFCPMVGQEIKNQ